MASKTRRPGSNTQRTGESQRRTITQRVMGWPRYVRTLIVFLGVLILAFSLMQVLGELYTRSFLFEFPLTTITWIVLAFCLGMYMAGYVYIIGMPGHTPPAGRAQSIYLLTITVLAVVSSIWIVVRAAGALAE